MKKLLSISVIAFAFISGCDYIEVPQQTSGSGGGTSDTVRKILIEDFTGHLCINCPDAALMMDSLERAFPGQIIGVSVHNGGFADVPTVLPNGAPPGSFQENFHTPEENDYDATFGGSLLWPLPMGLVNRYGNPLLIPTPVAAWPSTVANILAQPMTAYIKINPSYTASTRQLSVNISGKMMCDTTGNYNISIYLIEEDLHGYQLDDNIAAGMDTNFTFRHVLRGCINSPGLISGANVLSGTITNGTPINYSMSGTYTVPAQYDDTKCKLVAYIFNTADQGVLQAAECDLR